MFDILAGIFFSSVDRIDIERITQTLVINLSENLINVASQRKSINKRNSILIVDVSNVVPSLFLRKAA